MLPGVVGLMWADGRVIAEHVAGSAVLYDGSGARLPHSRRTPARVDTVFDVASLTKLFTATLALQQVEAGRLDLAAPVAHYLPRFAAHGKCDIRVVQLLTHTSGLEWWLPLWRDWPTREARVDAALTNPRATPTGEFVYSDLNLIALGVLLEKVSGTPLDLLLRDRVTEPLGMRDTGYAPQLGQLDPGRFAATEIEDDAGRGLVRGEVHDENAWSLGGVAGHAGVFSTAADLLTFARVFLDGGSVDGVRILSNDSVARMTTDLNPQLPGDAHGLGFEIDQPRYMGELSGPRTIGHTGFTGVSLVADLDRRAVAILLANAVHPHRGTAPTNAVRAAWATGLSRALA
nr:serine hydrolase domain-containing protein [Flexivirga meconopsidis]